MAVGNEWWSTAMHSATVGRRSQAIVVFSLAAALLAACGGGSSEGGPAATVAGGKTVASGAERERALSTAPVPDKPKVAAVAWSRYATASQQDHLARFGLALVQLPPTATPASMAATVAALKQRNPALQIAQITSPGDVADANTALAGPTTTHRWWLTSAAGVRTQWHGSAGVYDANMTGFTMPDANGRRYPQFRAAYDSATFFAPVPALDYVFANLVWPQQVNADWLRIGINQLWTDAGAQAAQRAGHAAYWTALRAAHPNLKVIANVAPAWIGSAEFAGRLNGIFLNTLIGRIWSIESYSGWPAMMAQYRAAMAHAVAPRAVIFHMVAASADLASMRYGLASALLDDGYFSLSATDGAEPLPWYDEFAQPLGSPIEPPPLAALAGTVWARKYSGGMVLVNTSKTTAATVDLGPGYRRFAGTQAPSVNNGQGVTTVTLPPRDGLLLLTASTAPPPDTEAPTPPGGLVLSGLACNAGTLSWQAASDNVAVTAYDVYHDGQLMTSVGGGTRSAALVLSPGARWGLYVNARDAAGNVSQASPVLMVQVPLCNTDGQAPTAPTGLQGSISGTTAYLQWSAATDNVAVTAYEVYRNDVRVGLTPALAHTDSGLAANTSYRYAVAARDAAGNVSPRSASLSLTTGGACANVVCGVTQVATDTDLPWGLVTLPDGQLIYSRRDAHDLVRLNPATGVKATIGSMPNAQSGAEGGVLGIAATAAFPATDPWLYVFYTTPTDNRVVRVQYRNDTLDMATLQVILSGIPGNLYHNGGRLRFGPDGKLYIATGDAQNGSAAQNLASLAGKILRINPDGSVPADNPFGSRVWSYGHRNPQGLAFDAQGRLWQHEFGTNLMDETNLVVKGGNYGYPNCEGTASMAGSGCATAGYIAPKATYPVADSSCSGVAVVRNALYVACLRGQRIYRADISGSELINFQQLFVGTYGRLRTIEPSIDGGLWMTTSGSGDKDSIANNSSSRVYRVNLGN
jgi:glucose/arabinose dehydrogenase